MISNARLWFAAWVLATLATSPLVADDTPPSTTTPLETPTTATADASPAEVKPAAASPTKAERDLVQREAYKKAVPFSRGAFDLESDVIKMRTLRNWALLTYPTGKMPPMALEEAKEHVAREVQDSAPWPGKGFAKPTEPGRAPVVPNTNTWTAVGPTPLDSVGTTNNAYTYGTVAGRASALAVDKNNTAVAYAGFAAGGLWKTTNLSAASPTWTPLWDSSEVVTQAVGAIAIDPNNSNIVYAGTGDWDAGDQFSAGILRTTDGGSTWTQLGADVFTPFSPSLPSGGNRWPNQNIKTIAIDPKNSNTLLVGTRYDLYLSNNGGSSWQICSFGNNYTNPSVSNSTVNAVNRISGIYLDSRGASTVAYVAVGNIASSGNGNNGVYRFTIPASGCPSWPAGYTTLFAGFPTGTGNGTNGGSTTGRIELAGAIGADSRLTLYAQVSDAAAYDNEGLFVLRPDLGSTTWTKLTETYSQCSNAGTGQDWYDLFVGVNPTNDKSIFVGHLDVYAGTVNSTYTSVSYTNLTDVYGTSCANYGKVHPDQHVFTWVGTSGSTFLVGNDGGVYKNTTGTAAGWSQINNSFNTNQFYAGQIGADFAGGGMGGTQWLFGGMQDNGNASWDSTQSTYQWTARSVGGDGFYTTFDPIAGSLTAGRWMTEYTYGDLTISTTGADGPYSGTCKPTYVGTADWSTPFVLDTLHCKNTGCSNYLLGEDYVWAATAYGASCPTWSRISNSMVKTSNGSIITVAWAPSDPKAAAVGTDDGKLWWSGTALTGANCTQAASNTSTFACTANTTATWLDADSTNAVLPNRAVLQVAFDPTNADVLYAAVGGFDDNTPTRPGHLFRATRSGSTVTMANKTGNLPDVPASAVAVNPLNRKQVFVGTHFGFYYTDDIDAATPTWVRYNAGLPNTVIAYLTVDRGPAANPFAGTTLAAFTYGRGVYVLKLPQPVGGNTAPSVTITAPATGSSYTQGSSVSFAGTATDTQDGNLSAAITWSSSINGALGTGASLSTSALSVGTHTITASATDSGSLVGTAAISVTITSTSNVLTNGVAVTGLAGATGSNTYFTMVVPAGATNLQFVTSGGTGDADLYARFGSQPTTTTYDCSSAGGTNAETCAITTASAGTYHVLVYGYAAYSGLQIVGSYSTGPSQVTVTFYSVAAEDGRIYESTETSNVGGGGNSTDATTSAARLGDWSDDTSYRNIFSFDTSSLPDGATIVSATLRLKRGSLTGTNPFTTHGTCTVDISSAFGGAVAFATGDFSAAATASGVASMSDPGANGSFSTGALNAAGRSAINKTGKTQFRVYFTLDDNDDLGSDYVGLYTGEAATGNKPELVVTYQ